MKSQVTSFMSCSFEPLTITLSIEIRLLIRLTAISYLIKRLSKVLFRKSPLNMTSRVEPRFKKRS